MKLIRMLLLLGAMLAAGALPAQVEINVTVGTPPPWGPYGYTEVRYYYIPDIEVYYDTQSAMFIYWGTGRWVYASSLPYRYRYYDLYSGYKVIIHDYRGPTPYIYFKDHKVKYPRGYRKGEFQKTNGTKPAKMAKASRSSVPAKSQRKSSAGAPSKSSPSPGNSQGGGGGKSHGNKGGGKGKGK